jgi:ethanolamine utilization protein EutA
VALAIGWRGTPRYQLLRNLAEGIKLGLPQTIANRMNVIIVFTHDFGKLVGEILRNDLGVTSAVVSIDSIHLRELDFIDIGEMIYPAQVVPVVVKSLVFPEVHGPVAEIAAG